MVMPLFLLMMMMMMMPWGRLFMKKPSQKSRNTVRLLPDLLNIIFKLESENVRDPGGGGGGVTGERAT
jgi:hypothetical protein